jgi:hypothetical protein
MMLRNSLVAIDRRNGRIVYDNSDSRGVTRAIAVEIRGDPAAKTVRVSTMNETVNLAFTDKPIRTSVRQSTGVKKPSGKLGEAILNAVEGAAGVPQ